MIRRMPVRAVLVRAIPLAIVVIAWAIVHPALGGRLRSAPGAGHGTPSTAASVAARAESRASIASILTRTFAVPFNLDHLLAPERGWPPIAGRALPSLIVLGLLAAWATRGTSGRVGPTTMPEESQRLPSRNRIIAFGAVWALCGWLPMLWPALGWHAYYTLLGALGAWIAIAAMLADHRRIAIALIAALVVLRAAQGATPSLDWGSEWYQNRAASFLEFMRDDLRRKQPVAPRHARLFFFNVPSNVGFMTEGGPALRVWYRDPTVSGGYLGQWTPRAANEPAGPDLFFRYDSTAGWIGIASGSEDTAAARRANPRWSDDHRELAAAFARAGAWRIAGGEYARLAAADDGNPQTAADAAVCFAMAGDSTAAARWFALAARAPDADDDIRRFAREFARHLRSAR